MKEIPIQVNSVKPQEKEYDHLAPDGSEIRLLVRTATSSTVHCRLRAGGVAKAVRHRTVEEIWYVLSGVGEFWLNGNTEIINLVEGLSFNVPARTAFQFRARTDLDVLITTTPMWPGSSEAEWVDGYWNTG